MTQDAQIVMDDFVDICRKAGNTVYNQGVVDGLVNLKNLINENENITLEELRAVIDEFIRKNTIGEVNQTKKETKITSQDIEENKSDDESHIDFSKHIPIEDIDHNIEDLINKKNDELRPEANDSLGMMGDLFGGMFGALAGSDNNIVDGKSEESEDVERKETIKEEISE